MGHLLKRKCSHSPLNLRILSSTSVPFTLTTVQVLNLALTHKKLITVIDKVAEHPFCYIHCFVLKVCYKFFICWLFLFLPVFQILAFWFVLMLAAHIFVVSFLFRENSWINLIKFLMTGPLYDDKVALTIFFGENKIDIDCRLLLNFILKLLPAVTVQFGAFLLWHIWFSLCNIFGFSLKHIW